MKPNVYVPDAIFNPDFALSEEPRECALNLAFNTQQTCWEWYDSDDYRRYLFNHAMHGMTSAGNPDAILQGKHCLP